MGRCDAVSESAVAGAEQSFAYVQPYSASVRGHAPVKLCQARYMRIGEVDVLRLWRIGIRVLRRRLGFLFLAKEPLHGPAINGGEHLEGHRGWPSHTALVAGD